MSTRILSRAARPVLVSGISREVDGQSILSTDPKLQSL